MKDLIERLEKATGPDRELDKLIWFSLGQPLPDDSADCPARYTASIDAALPDERIVEMVHTIDNTWIAWAHVRKGETVQGRSNANEAAGSSHCLRGTIRSKFRARISDCGRASAPGRDIAGRPFERFAARHRERDSKRHRSSQDFGKCRSLNRWPPRHLYRRQLMRGARPSPTEFRARAEQPNLTSHPDGGVRLGAPRNCCMGG